MAALSAMLLSIAIAAPVLADTELGHTGTVGAHSLRDSSTQAGVICTYKEVSNPDAWGSHKLRRIEVRPPRMKGVRAKKDPVAWRFFVERQTDGGPWTTTYRSPKQWGMASTSRNASFSRMSVNVFVPFVRWDESTEYSYRVKIKMFWSIVDEGKGGPVGNATHLVDWYQEIYPSPYGNLGIEEQPCHGWTLLQI